MVIWVVIFGVPEKVVILVQYKPLYLSKNVAKLEFKLILN